MKYVLLCLSLILSLSVFGQNAQMKTEGVLTSKKWTCMEVKRKKLEKMDFKFEQGNKLKFEIDKKYQYENNDYNYSSGEWKLDKKYIYLFYLVDADGQNRKEVATFKILKLNDNELRLKRMDRPKGKLVFK